MHESGYYESGHQENADETVVIISAGTFEIPTEKDGTLLLTSIQTQIPFASGLWYWSTDLRRKRAIKYDRLTSKLYPPVNGWGERTYYVSLLDNPHAGCVSGYGLDRYERATRLFQDSVHSVTRLVGIEFSSPSAFPEKDLLKTLKEENEKLKESLIVSPQFTEIPLADTHALSELQEKCNRLMKELENKEQSLKDSSKSKEEIELKLNGLAKEFDIAQAKVAELENAVQRNELEKGAQAEKFQIQLSDYEKRLDEFRLVDSAAQLKSVFLDNAEPLPTESNDENVSDERDFTANTVIVRELENELEQTKRNLRDVQSAYEQLKSATSFDDNSELLNSLRKQPEELKSRCTELESVINSKDQEIGRLQDRNMQIEQDLARTTDDLAKSQSRCKQLEDTVHALHQFSVHMKKQADDAKWRCGEMEAALKSNNPHILIQVNEKQLSDAKWRCDQLEADLHDKTQSLNELTKNKVDIENKLNEVQRNFDEAKRKLDEQDAMPEALSENETIARLQNQLQEYQQKYDDCKRKMDQNAEDSKWRYYELETSVRVLNKELEEQQVAASNKEYELINELDVKCREIEDLKQRLH